MKNSLKKYNHTTAKFLTVSALGTGLLFLAMQLIANSEPDTSNLAETTIPSTVNSSPEIETVATIPVATEHTFSSTVYYGVPKGHEELITVTATLDDDNIITAVETTHVASDEESHSYQAAFDQGYAQYVIGQPIEEVDLSRIAGASLTTDAFNLAIDDVLTQLSA